MCLSLQGGDVWELNIFSDNGDSIPRNTLEIEDNDTGRYRVLYTTDKAGTYEIVARIVGSGSTSLINLGHITVAPDSNL